MAVAKHRSNHRSNRQISPTSHQIGVRPVLALPGRGVVLHLGAQGGGRVLRGRADILAVWFWLVVWLVGCLALVEAKTRSGKNSLHPSIQTHPPTHLWHAARHYHVIVHPAVRVKHRVQPPRPQHRPRPAGCHVSHPQLQRAPGGVLRPRAAAAGGEGDVLAVGAPADVVNAAAWRVACGGGSDRHGV
jgi:hypothetical protein